LETLSTKKGALFIFLLGIVVFSLFLIPEPVEANIFDNVGDFLENTRDQVQNELDRSQVGRELNRIVEDLEAVNSIVEQFQDIVVLAYSTTTPIGIATLAVQYGHDPDQLFHRFQERADTLRSNNNAQQLSAVETAAALQSVLEEPDLPEGVYLGESCIIDFTGCPDESTSSRPTHRAQYWDYSCYVEGVIGKKKVNGLNRAVCQSDWVNTWSGSTAHVQFPVEHQFATYPWEQCTQVYLTPQEKDSFLDTKNVLCEQPTVAKYDLGDVCVVDYTFCGYGAGGEYNSNRIGTINYGQVIDTTNRYRREYACGIANGNYAIKESLRDSCSVVIIGQREVDKYISEHPEPIQQVVPPQIPSEIVQEIPQTPSYEIPYIVGLERGKRLGYSVFEVGDILQYEPHVFVEAYGLDEVVDISPKSIVEKKKKTATLLQEYGVPKALNIEELKIRARGLELPTPFDTLFGNEKMMVTIHTNVGENIVSCVEIQKGVVQEFMACPDSFSPSLYIYAQESAIIDLKNGADVTTLINEGRISYKAKGPINKVKFSLATIALKTFF